RWGVGVRLEDEYVGLPCGACSIPGCEPIRSFLLRFRFGPVGPLRRRGPLVLEFEEWDMDVRSEGDARGSGFRAGGLWVVLVDRPRRCSVSGRRRGPGFCGCPAEEETERPNVISLS